jgi:hypothetical protein
MRPALVSSVALAALSTLGDFIWATWIPRHTVALGISHGALLCAAVGLALGIQAGQPLRGAVGGAVIGAAAAVSYYVMAPALGFAAMFVAWFGLWITLAAMTGRLHRWPATWRVVTTRGVAAAAGSGLAFYLISGIWRPFDPVGWDYAVHFAAWTIAFLPGFTALATKRFGL